jgi:hypothetical protein
MVARSVAGGCSPAQGEAIAREGQGETADHDDQSRGGIAGAFPPGCSGAIAAGRFYLERELKDQEPAIEILGRITPLLAAEGDLLLEVERRNGRWHEVAKGSALKLIKVVASDTRGKFHGLGSLDKVLRKTGKGLTRQPVKKVGMKFIYTDSGQPCTAQEALFHYFGVAMDVIAEPSAWYAYHRVPSIVEAKKEKTRVLVRFTASSLSGSFGGTCLYAFKDGQWGA